MPKKLVKKSKKQKDTDLWGSVTTVPVLYKVNKDNTTITLKRIEWYA